ncbi:MAG: menaquinone-specific isochorismate synthase, partial [Actinomycetota bacterium]|nr:menaquinone-specific isochorismate synthase [Actinomycetota bacterium]
MTLVARTRRLDRDVDLLAVAGRAGILFEQHGCGFAGRGVARRIEGAQAVDDALAAIEVDDEVGTPGTGPVAFAALPFQGDGTFVVPELVVGKTDDGTRWCTVIGSSEGEPPPLLADVTEAVSPSRFDVRAGRPPAEWC